MLNWTRSHASLHGKRANAGLDWQSKSSRGWNDERSLPDAGGTCSAARGTAGVGCGLEACRAGEQRSKGAKEEGVGALVGTGGAGVGGKESQAQESCSGCESQLIIN